MGNTSGNCLSTNVPILFQDRNTGELLNENLSFTVGRDRAERRHRTSIRGSRTVQLLQEEVFLLRTLLSGAGAMLCSGSKLLCTDLLCSGSRLLRTRTMLRTGTVL